MQMQLLAVRLHTNTPHPSGAGARRVEQAAREHLATLPTDLQRRAKLCVRQGLLPRLVIQVQRPVQLLDQRAERLGSRARRGVRCGAVALSASPGGSGAAKALANMFQCGHTSMVRRLQLQWQKNEQTCCAASTLRTASAHRSGSGGCGGGTACIVTSTFCGI